MVYFSLIAEKGLSVVTKMLKPYVWFVDKLYDFVPKDLSQDR